MTGPGLAVLVTALYWTNPTMNAPDCGNVTTPLADLGEARLLCQRRWAAAAETVAVRDARGREGMPDSVTFDDAGLIWTCWVVTRDTAGNESCLSNPVGVNLTASVIGEPGPLARIFDVTGRRVEPPLAPGVYIAVEGGQRRRFVVLR